MNSLLSESAAILGTAGYNTEMTGIGAGEAVIFEDGTTLGFLFAYPTGQELVTAWERDSNAAISRYALALKRAGHKAWNTYLIFLAKGELDLPSTVALAAIEEDLTGTRKIARAGIRDMEDLRNALLTLLPLQSAPRLEAVDLAFEIRQRATELHARAVDGFLSAVDGSIVLQVLEEAP